MVGATVGVMNKIERIARSITASMETTVRAFVGSGVEATVADEQNTWQCDYDGKSVLTPDGMARWSADGTLELSITVSGNKATVHGLDSDHKEKSVCALFNTLAGNVNKNTFAKYVKEK